MNSYTPGDVPRHPHSGERLPTDTGPLAWNGLIDTGASCSARTATTPWLAIRGFMVRMLEKRWWIISIIFLGIAAGLIYTWKATPVYRTGSTIQVLREQATGTEFKEVVDISVRNSEDFNTQVKLLESVQIAGIVLSKLSTEEQNAMVQPYEDPTGFLRSNEPLDVLVRIRSIQPMRMTLMVAILVDHPDPALAAKIANIYATEFLNYNATLRTEGALKAVENLQRRAEEQRRIVEDLEMQLANFKEKHRSVSFDDLNNIDQQQLLLLSSEATAKQITRDEMKAMWEQVLSVSASGRSLMEVSSIRDNPVVMRLREDQAKGEVLVSQLSERYRSRHPRMQEARNMVDRVSRELTDTMAQVARGIENNYRRAEDLHTLARANMEAKQDEIVQRNKIRVEYNSLLRMYDSSREIYQYLYSRMQQAVSQASDFAPNVRIVDLAAAPAKPYHPRTLFVLGMSFVLSVGLGIGIAFLMSQIDDRIRSVHDLEDRLHFPVLGLLTEIKSVQKEERARTVTKRLHSVTVEEFRSLRSSIELQAGTRLHKVVLISSTTAEEGKSFLSSNLAATWASHGERTLLIDGDLRRPSISRSFGLPERAGLIQHLRDKMPLDEVIQTNVAQGLDVLCAGGHTQNPTELFTRLQLSELFMQLRKRYDRIVVDTPPLSVVSDGINFMPHIDGVILLFKFNTVPWYKAHRLLQVLREGGAPVLGAVLNYVNPHTINYYYPGYYHNDAAYYQQEPEKKARKQKAEPEAVSSKS